MTFLYYFFTSVITSSILLALAAFLFRAWAGARIKGEVETHYAKDLERHRTELRSEADRELERFRARLEEDRTLHAAATGAFASAHSAAAERRLLAVEEIWNA